MHHKALVGVAFFLGSLLAAVPVRAAGLLYDTQCPCASKSGCTAQCATPPRTICWTDLTITAGSTVIKGVDMDELLECTDMVLSQSTMTMVYEKHASFQPAGRAYQQIKWGDWNALQTNIDSVYTNAGASTPTIHNIPTQGGTKKVYAQTIIDLRNAIENAPIGGGGGPPPPPSCTCVAGGPIGGGGSCPECHIWCTETPPVCTPPPGKICSNTPDACGCAHCNWKTFP